VLPSITIFLTPSTIKLFSVTYNLEELYTSKLKIHVSQDDYTTVAAQSVNEMD